MLSVQINKINIQNRVFFHRCHEHHLVRGLQCKWLEYMNITSTKEVYYD